MNRGITLALSAYIFWGLHPVYWKQLQSVSSWEIVANRVIWSLVFFSIILTSRKQWKPLRKKVKNSPNKFILILPAFLIGSNWATYIWAVNAGFIIETSLGYFISPLVSVFLGVIFLKEHLRKIQWLAIFLAGLGVLIMTFIYGQFPWIAIYLAGTWGLYGLLRKKSPLNAVEGLTLETTTLLIPAIVYLIYLIQIESLSFFKEIHISFLFIGSGLISGLPLILFIASARLINLSLIGVLQYIYPTLIFLTGYFVYNESLTEAKIIGFSFIWIALIIYTIEGTLFYKRKETKL